MTRKFLLPAGLDQNGRHCAVREVVIRYQRKNLVTTGYVHDVYPNERGWVDQPGNTERKVYFAHIHTRRLRREDREQQMEIF